MIIPSSEVFTLSPQDFFFVGEGLSRPECVIAESDGTIWTSDDRATAMRIDKSGQQSLFGPRLGTPNGLAMDSKGVLYVSDIDGERVYRVFPDGRHEIVSDQLPGATNFVYLDDLDRLWVTVSTQTKPRSEAVVTPLYDGYIAVLANGKFRTVAEGICFTNELRMDDGAGHLYIAETTLGRIQRRQVHTDGSLGRPKVFGPDTLFPDAKIDGICFDSEGNLWVTEITRNSIFMISPNGVASCVFDDPEHLTLDFPTSIAFGGPDRRTAYVGSLNMDKLACFRAPFAGQRMRHWAD
jgi:gluconolactonase